MKSSSVFGVFGGVLLLATGLRAGNDLHLNGDFRGVSAPGQPAPGWISGNGGNIRILPGRKSGDFVLEITAAAGVAVPVASTVYPVAGNVLEIDAEVSGSGTGSIGYEGFDASCRQLLATEKQPIQFQPGVYEVKRYFTLNNPNVRFVRIVLTADAGSVGRFGDVDAEFEASAPAPMPVQPAVAPAAPAPMPVQPAVAPAAPAPMPVQPAVAPAAPARVLINDKHYFYNFLSPAERFQANIPVGSDVDFKLGEDVSGGVYWRVVSYDPRVVRVKLEHEQDGVWPLRYDKAEIEIKGLMPGRSTVEFTGGSKKVIVDVTVI